MLQILTAFFLGGIKSEKSKMTDKELLDKLFEFETYCTARFDSEARVAMAVYEYVKQMKRDTRQEMSSK